MAKTAIDWATDVWNPVTGCTPISPGCQNCYAKRMSKRLAGRCGYPKYDPFRVTLHPKKLEEPLKWKKPRRIFVNSMSDLFHEDVPDGFISDIYFVFMQAWEKKFDHTFMVLTKRPKRMMKLWRPRTPLPNLWLGVTCENQQTADERIPLLLQTPAAVRFVSVEPMLGPVDVSKWLREGTPVYPSKHAYRRKERLNWVIAGGETGPGARLMHPDWARSLRNQCQAVGVPFFFKQWGEWAEDEETPVCRICGCTDEEACPGGCQWVEDPENIGDICSNCVDEPAPSERPIIYRRVGNKAAGHLLDGREWREFPRVSP